MGCLAEPPSRAGSPLSGPRRVTKPVDTALDCVAEAGPGIDTVRAEVNYALGAGLENLVLAAVARIGTGNANNAITGNAAANFLNGGLDSDSLSGGLSNDTLLGGDGNDLLSGGGGADAMNGGLGADVYSSTAPRTASARAGQVSTPSDLR
jgi:Ca2+-binding RTX toxin-like protein